MAAAIANLDIESLGNQAEEMVQALGAISAEPGRLVRLFLTPEHRRAADLVAGWMQQSGLVVSEDALGTVRGRLGGTGKRRLLIGSHIDTVIDAGKYDGNFGVIAGIVAASYFARGGRDLPFGIDVLAFGDEEGSRYATTLSSSAAVAGVFDVNWLTQPDRDGVTLEDAIRAYGKNPDEVRAAAYRREEALAYVEVHIEQGPVLETRDQPLGVVTAIVGQTYFNVEVTGEAGHAGTVPMTLRRDALAGAAEMIQLAENLARENHTDVVATVGRLSVQPNASNVIPARVEFVLDLRSTSDSKRHAIAEQFCSGIRAIAERRHLGLNLAQTRNAETTLCDPRLQEGFASAVRSLEREPVLLGSGAGHDGQAMARLCPIGMLFVRCRGGISHNPMEYTSPRDMGFAIAALIRFIERFDVEAFG